MSAPAAAYFGPLLIETDVEKAYVDLLRTWLPTHIFQIELERDLSFRLARPVDGSYAAVMEDDEFPSQRLPAILVTVAGMDNAVKDGDGHYIGSWSLTVTAINRGRTSAEARAYASLYGGAIKRTLGLQVPELGEDRGYETVYERGVLGPVSDITNERRHLAASLNYFTVYTDAVLYAGPGGPYLPDDGPYDPADPDNPDEPYDPLASVASVTVDVEGVALNETPGGEA